MVLVRHEGRAYQGEDARRDWRAPFLRFLLAPIRVLIGWGSERIFRLQVQNLEFRVSVVGFASEGLACIGTAAEFTSTGDWALLF